MTRAGIVTVVGKPNVGKSTLLNRLVGQKLSIVSSKPQSTRDRIVGIRSEGDVQMVVFDTPGLLSPRYALQRAMRSAALRAIDDADVIVYLVEPRDPAAPSLQVAAELDAPPRAPVLTVVNKVDTLTAEQRAALETSAPGALLVSALTGEGVDTLLAECARRLPESPFLYPAEDVSTQPQRFFVAELIRETALEQLEEELPYSVACEIEEFREGQVPVYIRAVLHVERDSQKRILIGAKGARVRSIGQAARVKIEAFLDQRVYLDLWVKVLPNWRKSGAALHRFGYQLPEERPS